MEVIYIWDWVDNHMNGYGIFYWPDKKYIMEIIYITINMVLVFFIGAMSINFGKIESNMDLE